MLDIDLILKNNKHLLNFYNFTLLLITLNKQIFSLSVFAGIAPNL